MPILDYMFIFIDISSNDILVAIPLDTVTLTLSLNLVIFSPKRSYKLLDNFVSIVKDFNTCSIRNIRGIHWPWISHKVPK